MSEAKRTTQKIINFIHHTLSHYKGDIGDLEWSTEQVQTLLSSVESKDKEIEELKEEVKKLKRIYNQKGY